MTAVKFGTDEWIKAFQAQLNASEAYAEAGKTWEGDFYFIVEPEGALTEPIYMYMDFYHGECRDAYVVQNKADKNPPYTMSAPYGTWKKVITGKLDPILGLGTGQLKLKGDMVRLMLYVKAAQEIMKACTRVETEFPV